LEECYLDPTAMAEEVHSTNIQKGKFGL